MRSHFKRIEYKLLLIGLFLFFLALCLILFFPVPTTPQNGEISDLLFYVNPLFWFFFGSLSVIFLIIIGKSKNYKIALLVLILIIFLSYSVSFYGSSTLMGHDSYLHLATTQEILRNGQLTVTSTVYSVFPGYFIFIEILRHISGLTGSLLVKLIAPFFSTFTILMYYPAFKSWTRSNEWTLFAILALFVSDVGFLTGYTPSPSMLANLLFPIILYSITKETRQYTVLTFLIMFLISIVHPSTALFIPFLFLFFFLFQRSTLNIKDENSPKFLLRTIVPTIMFSSVIAFVWSTFYSNLFIENISQGLGSFIISLLEKGWGYVYSPILPSTSSPLLYLLLRALSSYALLLIAPIGLLSLSKTQKRLAFFNGSWLFLAVIVFLFGSVAMGDFYLWDQLGIRVKSLALFPLALLGGYGLLFFFRQKTYPMITFLKPLSKLKRLKSLIYIFTLIMILITPMSLYWNVFDDRLLAEDVQAFSFLGNYKLDESTVLGFAPILDYYGAYKLSSPVLGTEFYTGNLTLFEDLIVNNNIGIIVLEKYLPVRFGSSEVSNQIYLNLSEYLFSQSESLIYDNGVCQIFKVHD